MYVIRPARLAAILLLFAAITGLSLPAMSSETGVPPDYSGNPPDYQLADGVIRTVLPNGVIVIVKPDRHASSVAIELMARVGAAEEDNTTSGMATLVGKLLERRLSEDHGKKDDLMGRTGSESSVNVTLDYTELAVETPRAHAKEVLARVVQAYGRRPFNDDEVEDERKKMQRTLEQGESDFLTIYDIFLVSFYRYHPYRQPLGGSAAVIRNLRAADINAFLNRWYAANRTIISVVGNVDSAAIVDQLQASMADLKPVHEKEQILTWEAESTEKELQLSGGKQLAFVFLGYPAPDVASGDFPAMRVLNAIMGTGISSRIWLDLREERGLAYSLGTEYPVLQGPGHLLCFVVTPPQSLRIARRRLFAQIDRIRKEPVQAWEVSYAKWKVLGELLASIETPHGKALQLASMEALGVGYQFTDRFVHDMWNVSSEDVHRVANKYLDNYTLIMARPADINPFP